MLIGYARISTKDQNLDLQRDALKSAGCKRTVEETASGANNERPALRKLLQSLRPGDVLVVWRLCRLSRDLEYLIQIRKALTGRKVTIQSTSESINTATSMGRYAYNIVGANYEFERDTISERTQAGMAAAKRRGKHVGRPRCMSQKQIERAMRLANEKSMSPEEIAVKMKVGRTTVWRALREWKGPA